MAKKTGKAWTPAQHKKFKATMAAKKRAGEWADRTQTHGSSIPFDAIPARSKGRSKRPVTASKFDMALDLLDLAVKMLKAAK